MVNRVHVHVHIHVRIIYIAEVWETLCEETAFIEISLSPPLLTCVSSFFSTIFYLHLLVFLVSSFVAL